MTWPHGLDSTHRLEVEHHWVRGEIGEGQAFNSCPAGCLQLSEATLSKEGGSAAYFAKTKISLHRMHAESYLPIKP